jgi:NTE family protein
MSVFTRASGAAIACLLFTLPAVLLAQTAPAPGIAADAQAKRPKIGLVLSGGGARGAAHIGVLKVLDELRVPVDVIAGTSMGSIVGAAYATGMSAEEMEKAIASISTASLFADRPPRQDQTMRVKEDDLQPFIVPELGLTRGGIQLPKGIVTGVALEGELRKLVQIANVRSFDELPIPFRAIATDIGTGEMVVLKEGSVVQAIRASMSVPGAVAPVEMGRRLLVDGGLVRNLPVDIARSMGADIIIAVNLGTPLLKPEQITSVLSVSLQMINILTEQNVNRSLAELKPQDILIVPALGDFSSADFDNLPKTVPIGEAAARQVADRLRALSLPPEQYAELRKRQAAPAASGTFIVDAIRVEGTKRVSHEVVLQVMQTRVGQPLERDQIDLDMRRIYGRGDFSAVNYTVEQEGDKHTLVVLVRERPEQHYVRFGLELEAALGTQASFNFLASHRMKWVNAFGGEWRNDIVLGRDVLLQTEFYQPLSASQYFFVSPQLRYSIRPFDIYADDLQIAEYRDTAAEFELDLGANFLQYGYARLGTKVGRRRFEIQSGGIALPAAGSAQIGEFSLRVNLDQFDGINFPTRGYSAYAGAYSSTDLLGADDTYSRWDTALSTAFTFGKHTFEAYATAGGPIGTGGVPVYDQRGLGGFLKLSGLSLDQLRSDRYVFGRLIYRTKLADIPMFEGVYAGGSIEAARLRPLIPVWEGKPVDGQLLVNAASVFLGVDSPLGPLYVGIGYANRDNMAVYLFLGRP